MTTRKPSLATALQRFDRAAPQQALPPAAPAPRRAARPRAASSTTSSVAPSRVGKKALIGYFDPEVSKQLKLLALERDTSTQELLREALNDFFQKNKKPAIA